MAQDHKETYDEMSKRKIDEYVEKYSIEKLQDLQQQLHRQQKIQKHAKSLLNRCSQTKQDEIDLLLQKRQDIYLDRQNKEQILEQKQAEYSRQLKSQSAKPTSNSETPNPNSKKNKNSRHHEQTQQAKVKTHEQEGIEEREKEDLKQRIYNSFSDQLAVKLDELNSAELLEKRFTHKNQSKQKTSMATDISMPIGEQDENSANSIQVKIFACSIINQKYTREMYKNGEIDQDLNQQLLRYRMFVETFRISQVATTVKQLKTQACNYWGLLEKDFELFKTVSKTQIQNINEEEQGTKVSQIVKSLVGNLSKEQAEEMRDNQKNLLATFYLGRKVPEDSNLSKNAAQGPSKASSKKDFEEQPFNEQFEQFQKILKEMAEKSSAAKAAELQAMSGQREQVDKEEEFLSKFSGLKAAYVKRKKQTNKDSTNLKNEGGFPECCRMFIMILMFILTQISLNQNSQPTMAYYVNKRTQESLLPGYLSVEDTPSLRNFLVNDIADYFFDNNDQYDLTGNITLDTQQVDIGNLWHNTLKLGKICFISHRAQEVECPQPNQQLENIPCYPNFLHENQYYTKPLLSKDGQYYEWNTFRDGSKDSKYGGGLPAGHMTGWTGKFALTKGYYQCFDHKEISKTDYQQTVELLLENGFLGNDSRSFIISYTTYHTPTEYYLHVNMLFEYVHGLLERNRFSATPFKTPLNMDDDFSNTNVIFTYYMRWVLVFICILQVFVYFKSRGSLFNLLKVETFQHTGLIMLVIITQIFSLQEAAYTQTLFPCPPTQIMDLEITGSYWAVWTIAEGYKSMLFSDALSMIAMFSNILTMLKHFRWVEFFLDSVTHSLKIALSYLAIFVASVCGLAICCMTLYGMDSLRYATFGNSFFYLFYNQIFYEPNATEKDTFWGFVFKFMNILIYYVFQQYQLFAVFISIMYEAYRNTAIEKGDPLVSSKKSQALQDDDDHEQQSADVRFFLWFFAWVPANTLKRCITNQDDQDSDDPDKEADDPENVIGDDED